MEKKEYKVCRKISGVLYKYSAEGAMKLNTEVCKSDKRFVMFVVKLN